MSKQDRESRVSALQERWTAESRWTGIERAYTAEEVVRLQGSVVLEQSLARRGAERLWEMLQKEEPVRTFGALTGAQGVQMARAGLEAIYLSGWQVAADANLASHTYPDQSLYPANSVPMVVKRINNALMRADAVEFAEGTVSRDWLVPIVADAEAGFGGPLNAFELMKAMIEAGAAGVHFEDQLAAERSAATWAARCSSPPASSSAP
jgi:isocitrate lyase